MGRHGIRTDGRVRCGRCGTLLPLGYEASDCLLCARRDVDMGADGQCRCDAPLPIRRYLGGWLCVCGSLCGSDFQTLPPCKVR